MRASTDISSPPRLRRRAFGPNEPPPLQHIRAIAKRTSNHFPFHESLSTRTEDHLWVPGFERLQPILTVIKDISARSPVVPHEVSRQSLDSARIPRLPRSAMNERRFERQPPTAEEGFEDVGLNDEAKQVKKKGFFSKFGENAEPTTQSQTASRFHIGGRKRGQSGVGEELGNIPQPGTPGSKEVKEVH